MKLPYSRNKSAPLKIIREQNPMFCPISFMLETEACALFIPAASAGYPPDRANCGDFRNGRGFAAESRLIASMRHFKMRGLYFQSFFRALNCSSKRAKSFCSVSVTASGRALSSHDSVRRLSLLYSAA